MAPPVIECPLCGNPIIYLDVSTKVILAEGTTRAHDVCLMRKVMGAA